MSFQDESLQNFALYSTAFIGWIVCVSYTIKGAYRFLNRVFSPLWLEARTREKRIEFASAIAAMVALIVSLLGLLYTIRQVDSATDRISVLEKMVEAKKVEPEASKR